MIFIPSGVLDHPFMTNTSMKTSDIQQYSQQKVIKLTTPFYPRKVIGGIKSKMSKVCTGCLRKKYGVADYQYFENGKTQQCDIFRLN